MKIQPRGFPEGGGSAEVISRREPSLHGRSVPCLTVALGRQVVARTDRWLQRGMLGHAVEVRSPTPPTPLLMYWNLGLAKRIALVEAHRFVRSRCAALLTN